MSPPSSRGSSGERPAARPLGRLQSRILAGWGSGIPSPALHDLWWFWWDGAFALGYDSIITTYLILYAAALGATGAQVGAMSSLGSLSAALVLLPGALLVERLGRRRRFALLIGFCARLMLIGLACVPLLQTGFWAIALVIAFSAARDAFNFLANPAWVSLTADIVPGPLRGRYFASRNFANTIVGMVAVFLAGLLITQAGGVFGYQLAFAIAFLFGLASTYCFGQIREPAAPAAVKPEPFHPVALARTITAQPAFLWFCLTGALFNFSLNVAGPFFNLHLVQNLHATPSEVGILTAATSLTMLLTLRTFGNLTDRFGAHRVAVVTGLAIPVLPLMWVFATSPWHILPINILSGVLWGGYNLAVFNLLLSYTPDAQRARFSAVYQILITLSLSGGAAFGGWISTLYPFQANFLLSCIGRFTAALLFLFLVPAADKKSASGTSEGAAGAGSPGAA